MTSRTRLLVLLALAGLFLGILLGASSCTPPTRDEVMGPKGRHRYRIYWPEPFVYPGRGGTGAWELRPAYVDTFRIQGNCVLFTDASGPMVVCGSYVITLNPTEE